MLIITEIKWEESIIMSRKSYKIIKESQGIFKDSQSINTTTGKKKLI